MRVGESVRVAVQASFQAKVGFGDRTDYRVAVRKEEL
jgi:hypothetical protein